MTMTAGGQPQQVATTTMTDFAAEMVSQHNALKTLIGNMTNVSMHATTVAEMRPSSTAVIDALVAHDYAEERMLNCAYLRHLGANGVNILMESSASDAKTGALMSQLRALLSVPEATTVEQVQSVITSLAKGTLTHMQQEEVEFLPPLVAAMTRIQNEALLRDFFSYQRHCAAACKDSGSCCNAEGGVTGALNNAGSTLKGALSSMGGAFSHALGRS